MAESARNRSFWAGQSSGILARLILGLALFTGDHALGADSGVLGPGEYDRPGPNPHQSRSVVTGKYGMVAASQPLAAQTGLDILKSGGNAIDAAIAANAMIGLVEPGANGIGGDLFVIYWDAKTQKLYGLNASGRSPQKLNREVFAKQGLKEIPDEGPLS